MTNRTAILSAKYPQFAESLHQNGYSIIYSENVSCLIDFEQEHADLQCLLIDNTAFVLQRCKSLAESLKSHCNIILCADDIGRDYPKNTALSATVVGKNVICRTDSIDKNVEEYCKRNEYRLINVRQGYAKCACAIVSDNAIITADKGIYRDLAGTEIEVLLIKEGRVRLDGANHGFVGGASGYDSVERKLYFCGDIMKHPDYERIIKFCETQKTHIVSLTSDELIDIGGILFC